MHRSRVCTFLLAQLVDCLHQNGGLTRPASTTRAHAALPPQPIHPPHARLHTRRTQPSSAHPGGPYTTKGAGMTSPRRTQSVRNKSARTAICCSSFNLRKGNIGQSPACVARARTQEAATGDRDSMTQKERNAQTTRPDRTDESRPRLSHRALCHRTGRARSCASAAARGGRCAK